MISQQNTSSMDVGDEVGTNLYQCSKFDPPKDGHARDAISTANEAFEEIEEKNFHSTYSS